MYDYVFCNVLQRVGLDVRRYRLIIAEDFRYQVKCAQYWPDTVGTAETHEDVRVCLKNELHYDVFVQRKVTVRVGTV